jgi:hypothetical protein
MKMWKVFLLLLVPALLNASTLQWTVDQPHRYIIYNGKYVPLPVASEDTNSPSVLESLNPLSTFGNIWAGLPSLNFFKSSEPGAIMSDDTAADYDNAEVPPGVGMLAEGSAPIGSHIPFSEYMTPDPAPPTPSSGFFSSFLPSFSFSWWPAFLGGGSGNSNSDKVMEAIGSMGMGGIGGFGGGFMKRSMNVAGKDPKAPKDPVKYLYVPQGGQGGFLRYEIPIPNKPTPEEKPKSAEHAQPEHPYPYPYMYPNPNYQPNYPPTIEAQKKPTAPYKPQPHREYTDKDKKSSPAKPYGKEPEQGGYKKPKYAPTPAPHSAGTYTF